MASGQTLGTFTPQDQESGGATPAALANNALVRQFNSGVVTTCNFRHVMPKEYGGGNIVVTVTWSAATATTGNIILSGAFERGNQNNHSAQTDAFNTATNASASTTQTVAGKETVTTWTITAGTTTDSIAAADMFRFQLARQGTNGSDNLSGFVNIESVLLNEA